jgi:hypothetical protein
LLPGILDLKAPLNDLVDSFVSALLNEGYDWRLSKSLFRDVCDALPFGVDAPLPFEGWFPIVRCFYIRQGRGTKWRIALQTVYHIGFSKPGFMS